MHQNPPNRYQNASKVQTPKKSKIHQSSHLAAVSCCWDRKLWPPRRQASAGPTIFSKMIQTASEAHQNPPKCIKMLPKYTKIHHKLTKIHQKCTKAHIHQIPPKSTIRLVDAEKLWAKPPWGPTIFGRDPAGRHRLEAEKRKSVAGMCFFFPRNVLRNNGFWHLEMK